VLALKIPALLQVLCKGGFARWGPWKKTIVAMSERSRHVERLPDASTVAPGYVCTLSRCCFNLALVCISSTLLKALLRPSSPWFTMLTGNGAFPFPLPLPCFFSSLQIPRQQGNEAINVHGALLATRSGRPHAHGSRGCVPTPARIHRTFLGA